MKAIVSIFFVLALATATAFCNTGNPIKGATYITNLDAPTQTNQESALMSVAMDMALRSIIMAQTVSTVVIADDTMVLPDFLTNEAFGETMTVEGIQPATTAADGVDLTAEEL